MKNNDNDFVLPFASLARKRKLDISESYADFVLPDSLVNFPYDKTFFIRTYGCQANYRDEEIISALLSQCGFVRKDEPTDATIIFLNTCAVRENAEQKLYGHLGELKNIKQKDKKKIICLCGCMMQEEGTIAAILEKYPYISLIFGTHNVTEILTLLDRYLKEGKYIIDVPSCGETIRENIPEYRNSKFKAFVNIAYGCDKFCTYCVVPYTRGQERSRKMEDILRECSFLADNGYQEITLLGQNVNSYGKDLKDGSTFAKLLDEVAKLNIPRIRFLTSYPSEFGDDVIDVIAKHDNLMKYIHLPVQAGNNRVLKAMGRRYTREQYIELVEKMRKKIPNLSLSTDIIVGFPNETHEEFMDTIDLVKKVDYASAFTFIFSPRRNTPAAKIVDTISKEEKGKNFKLLVSTLEEIMIEHDKDVIGKTFKVLVEGPSEKNKDMLSGYTEENKLVHFKGDSSLIGTIINVKIIESHVYSWIGEIVCD